MKKITFYLIFLLLLSITVQAQNVRKYDIERFPIPRTLEKCFKLLDKTMPDHEMQLIKVLQEDSIYFQKEFFPGRDFFHVWKIYDGSRLTKYFNKKGLYGSFEIYNTILVSYHRYLNNEEIHLDIQINKYKLKQEEDIREYLQKLQNDTIYGVYIPISLEDCFIQLDKLLSDEDKQTIKQLADNKETIRYHHDVGMWLRNNWGLWGGSRLQKYMLDKKINHPDKMSAIILEFYYDWLNGKNDEWMKFEVQQITPKKQKNRVEYSDKH